jgi:nucleotide-binding universal stress UspA family protein
VDRSDSLPAAGGPEGPGGDPTILDPSTLDTKPAERILVPLGLAPAGEAKLPVVAAQARALGADVVLLHVLASRAAAGGGPTAAESRARAYLDTVAAGLRGAGVDARALLRTGDVAPVAAAAARELGATLLVAGADARRGPARLFPGGHAAALAARAPCPVLFVRPDAARLARTPSPGVPRGFAADAARVGPAVARPRSPRAVEVARIVGTVADPADYRADFRPRRRWKADEQRFRRVQDALAWGVALPPVELHKLGYGYYVVDGHHRVAAARRHGQQWLDAAVTEFLPVGDPEAHRVFAERLRFEQATGLTRVGAGRPGSYPRLEELVRAYATVAGLADAHEAGDRWYARVFRPAQLAVRALGLGQHVPGERSADVLVRAVARLPQDGAQRAAPEGWTAALRALAAERRAAAAAPPESSR